MTAVTVSRGPIQIGLKRRRNLKQDYKNTEIQQFSMSIQVFGAGPYNFKVSVYS